MKLMVTFGPVLVNMPEQMNAVFVTKQIAQQEPALTIHHQITVLTQVLQL